MKVLELGSYIAPAYAGMLLAEQGHQVVKFTTYKDPVLGLHRGHELWEWINQGKLTYYEIDWSEVPTILGAEPWDIVIDNIRPASLEKLGIDPVELAAKHDVRWVSIRSDLQEAHEGRSFDVVAQARAWMDYTDWLPFYVGDTTAGLWACFKALVQPDAGHFVVHQATALQKLVEGELVVDIERPEGSTAWDDPGDYSGLGRRARVQFKGAEIVEPARDRAWKLANLHHDGSGRMVI